MKQKKQIFKIKESVNIIDRNGRVWIIIEQSDSAIKLQAVEEDPLPNCIVVKKDDAFFMCYKEYIPPKSTRKKKTVQWYEKKEKGSYFNPAGRPKNVTSNGNHDIPWLTKDNHDHGDNVTLLPINMEIGSIWENKWNGKKFILISREYDYVILRDHLVQYAFKVIHRRHYKRVKLSCFLENYLAVSRYSRKMENL